MVAMVSKENYSYGFLVVKTEKFISIRLDLKKKKDTAEINLMIEQIYLPKSIRKSLML